MIKTDNAYICDIKNDCSKVKNFATIMIIAAICLSVVYFLYWIAVMSEPYVLTYTENTFAPLAKLFSFGDTSVEMYRRTSVVLFSLIIPLNFVYYLCDKIEDKLIESYIAKKEQEERQTAKRAHLKDLRQYDDIKSYSICLSLDYKAKRVLTQATKQTLNKIIYSKFKSVLEGITYDLNISTGDVLIITSSDFSKYDNVYETTLKILAKIKSYADNKYDLETIPSLTTDAYITNAGIESIKKNHFEIQSCNFQNRACSTAIFTKKYKHINKNKYAGVPIGEYSTFDKDDSKTFELNIIYKNLSQTLASLK